jgi:hypothetical protein
MPHRYRVPYRAVARSGLIAVAFLIGSVWLIAAAHSQPKQGADTHADTQQPKTEVKQEPQPVIPTVIQDDIARIARALEAANAHPNAATEEQQARDNLKAQQDIALWAEIMLFIAGGEILVTLIGVGLVGLTLSATRRAANAAEQSVSETRRIGEAQTRAYVTIKQASITFMMDVQNPLVTFIATNSGQSPARNYIWNVAVQYPEPSINKCFVLIDERWLQGTGMDIPAGSDSPPENVMISAPAKIAIERPHPGTTVTVVRVKIDFRYTDVFDRHWNGAAYFVGAMRRQSGTPEGLKSGAPRWAAILEPIPHPSDWDSIPIQ